MNSAIVAWLKAAVPELKLVGEAADFQTAADNKPNTTPACFVIPLAERPNPSADADIGIQRVFVAVGIVLVVRNVADTKGTAAGADLTELRKKVKAALFGWSAMPDFAPFERGDSQLLGFKDGYMWWQDIYLTDYYDRSVL